MSSLLERSFKVLELLSTQPEGCPLSQISSDLQMPLSATHRLLTEMGRCGYVRQAPGHGGNYMLTIKLVALGLGFLSTAGIVDIAQPLLDRMAQESGELVRLAVVDDAELIFVAKAQGATRGLRYDPDMGLSVPLSCSAAGHAWLSTMDEDEVLLRVSRQGLGAPADFGPRAPTSLKAVLAYVRKARKLGFSTITEVFAPAMAAMAAPVTRIDGQTIGVVTIAGPLVRLTEARMQELGPALMETAREVAGASGASALFKRSRG